MVGASSFLLAMVTMSLVNGENMVEEDLADTIKLLREQVSALFDHRQEDYNALEESLKRAIEKNTELFVLRNEVKQLRKDVNALRGGNGNEAKNERLRVRWLGSAVTELQSEVAEVLRARNASEELAERSRMRSELALLKGDVAEVGRDIRNLGGRIAKIEAALGTIRVDIAAVKERSSLLSRSYADITSQVNSIQMEVKSLKRSEFTGYEEGREAGSGRDESQSTATLKSEDRSLRRRVSRRHGYSRYRARLENRLKSLERKISVVSQKRASLEKRVAYESQEYLGKRVRSLERVQIEFARVTRNISEELSTVARSLEFKSSKLLSSLRALEDNSERNRTEINRELSRLGVNAARKAAELSLTREELANLRRAVQALSVTASKQQERSDRQQEGIDRLNRTLLLRLVLSAPSARSSLDSRFVRRLPLVCEKNPDGPATLFESEENLASATATTTTTAVRSLDESAKIPSSIFCHGGWLVIARRVDGSLDFDRTWKEYSLGFGTAVPASSEFWIGNELLRKLTVENCASLRIDLMEFDGTHWRAEYDSFEVGSEESGYRLRVSGYTGNATDALSYQNGVSFSAKDRDRDLSASDCAANYGGGWWFSHCQHANLNGKYSLGLSWFRVDIGRWILVAGSEMSIRIKPACRR